MGPGTNHISRGGLRNQSQRQRWAQEPITSAGVGSGTNHNGRGGLSDLEDPGRSHSDGFIVKTCHLNVKKHILMYHEHNQPFNFHFKK